MNEKETAIALNCSIYTLQKDRVKGNNLPFIKIGRNVRYLKSDIENYIKSRKFNSTSEYQAQLRK